ncbi:MAG TPA: TolC family protein [Phycisphaerae bacterium]|nr:TolC family protein [Phycisphaerae bacterium]HRW54446.1 TolC family protein [Phycisphaerae bacterium]
MLFRRPFAIPLTLATLLLSASIGAAQNDMTPVGAAKPSTLTISPKPGADSRAMPEFNKFDRGAPAGLPTGRRDETVTLDTTIWYHLPDPIKAPQVLDKRLAITEFGQDLIRREHEEIYSTTKALIREIDRPDKIRLSLDDCLRRAVTNNYQIKNDAYAPAISTAQIVQAEGAFDPVFFFNANRNNTDRPTPSALQPSATDTTAYQTGIRKLLTTGATVTLTEAMARVDNPGFTFQTLNPSWTHNFIAELRQPILRNFGADITRSQINIRKHERRINEEQFRGTVTEILSNTEQAYWQLVAARRNVVIAAEILAQAKLTYTQVKAREDFDAYQVLLKQSEANLRGREFQYIDVKNNVRNAEDQLLNLLNDPELPMSADFEIVPVDEPIVTEIIHDRFDAVETALERRPEIIQSRRAVDIARINLGISKNQALPTLDLVYRATVSGLGASSDSAFDQMTTNNFIDQYVGVEFAWSFGERAERAGIRIAAFQQSQAVLSYKQALDNIITDCRVALRNLTVNYEQMGPSHKALLAANENLRSLQERQERKSPAELDAVFNAQARLADSRRALLQSAIDYNIGLVNVERAKGTLLEYNNISLDEAP